MYRRVALTATVACGALLFIGHLKRKFRRNACAAVRVFIHQLQKARHETLKVTWFATRGLADGDALRALLDPRVELVVVATGRLADVDAATEILTERRRYAAVADAINAVAKSGDFARLATGPIGGLNIDAGY
ncbi:phosphoglycerate dehydrogenase [Aureococcus anophagefferens]|nr:phosphoglycerate dehydrogenase [Aureococcus anophagefferens]